MRRYQSGTCNRLHFNKAFQLQFGHSKCPLKTIDMKDSAEEIFVFSRLERDEQGRLVIALYYKKV